MTLYFDEEGELTLPLSCRETAEKVIETALNLTGCPYEAEVSLLLTMDAQIQEMNTQFRGIERATDVLSFPMIEYPAPGEFGFLEGDEGYFNPESGELSLGDIVISKEKVVSQADEYGHSILREYAFLIVHSALHLTGYDHIEEDDRRKMEAKQDEIMKFLNILR